jgi:hypothetical protein
MLNTPNTQPGEEVSSQRQTLTGRISNAIMSSKAVIAAAIGLASVTGCKDMKNDLTETKPVPTATNTAPAVVTPYGEGRKAPEMTPKDFVRRWCAESREAVPNEMGPNTQFVIIDDGNGEGKDAVIELCARGGAKEVKTPCPGYAVSTDGGTYKVGNGDSSYATVEEKIPLKQNNLVTEIPYRTRDGKIAAIDGDDLIVDGFMVDKAVCAGEGRTTYVKYDKDKKQDEAIAKLGEGLAAVGQRVARVESGINTLATSMERFAQGHTDKRGACVSYAETPEECENLERTNADHATNEEKAKQ